VTLTGQGDDTDHHAVGAAVNTISSNLPEMAKGVKMLAALMDDEGANGDDLMLAAKQVRIENVETILRYKLLFFVSLNYTHKTIVTTNDIAV
jgi:hypothetical protein